MLSAQFAMLFIALLAFIFAAINYPPGLVKINLLAIGLAALVLSLMIGRYPIS
jgi:hypothetical protein